MSINYDMLNLLYIHLGISSLFFIVWLLLRNKEWSNKPLYAVDGWAFGFMLVFFTMAYVSFLYLIYSFFIAG